MWTCFVLVVVVPAVAATAWAAYSYSRFRRTPAGRWRDRILGRAADLKREIDAARRPVERPDHAAVERRLFDEHLATVPVGAVERFAGIGPGTVDRLRGAGLRSLADLVGYPVHTLGGFGPSRTADVRAAVTQLVAEARQAFANGDGAKGREYHQYRQQAEQRRREQEAARVARLTEREAELDAMRPDLRRAEAITWVRYLRNDGEFADVPAELPAEPVARRDDEGTADPDASIEVVVVPANAPPSPTSPVAGLDVTLTCATCDAKLKVSSSRRRTQFRVTCPRCGAVSSVTMPASSQLPVIPPVAKPVPPPTPVPVNAPRAASPRSSSPPAPPRASSPVPLSPPPPTDLFADALSSSGVPRQPSAEHPGLPKLRTFAAFGLMVAKSDGRIAKAERAAVRGFLVTLFAHDPTLARHIDPVLEATEKAVPGENEAIANVIRRSDPTEWAPLYRAATKIADACGKRNRQETDLLERVAVGLGVVAPPPVPPPAPAKVVAPPKPASDPRQVLELEPSVELSAELVRRRFTLLFERADPAKAAALGPEFAAMAEQKRAALRTAAEALIAAFGVPLDPPPAPPPPADLRHNPDLDDVFG